MDALTREFARLVFRRWARDGVPWLLVGGQAMVAHGLAGERGDVDVLLPTAPAALALALAGVAEVGSVPTGAADRLAVAHRHVTVTRWRPGGWARLDLSSGLLHGTFAGLWEGRVTRKWEGMEVPTLNLADLAASKAAVGWRGGKHQADGETIRDALSSAPAGREHPGCNSGAETR